MRKYDFNTVSRYCIFVSEKRFASDRIKKIAADYFCKISLDNKPDQTVLSRLGTSYQDLVIQSRLAAQNENNVEALSLFSKAVKKAGVPDPAVVLLSDIFRLVTLDKTWERKKSSEKNEENHGIGSEIKSSKKIILSGMYWSGTGALYDFFREFSNVAALPGEQRLWKESDYSLNWGLKNIDNISDVDFVKYLERLFLIPLAGLAIPRTWQDVLAENVGINFIRNESAEIFSVAVYDYIKKIKQLWNNNSLDSNTFLNQSVVFTDRILNSFVSKGKTLDIIVPDNAIHIADIEPFRFFSNSILVCVFRDPRSNYAARYRENERFDKNPENFIKYYRETREKFCRDLIRFGKDAERIIEVKFEDFILSEKFRISLAERLGLDLSGWERGKFFLQNKSDRNVYNYRKFHDQGIIRLISDSLEEYCSE